MLPMTVFLQLYCLGKCTGISFIDSTPIRVCHIKREKQHKVLRVLSKKVNVQWAGFMGLSFI